MTDLQTAPRVPYATPPLRDPRERLVRAAADLWRVVAHNERVIGHVRVVGDPLGLRYRAERLHRATGAFIDFGAFWTADEAVAALRHSR
ncbi:hypothetical protein [Microbacterium sp. Marseille-Q6965]|uniref:hypothetical protein n=1 Tax=Microbacterium sp. Marseille-Q6965 TaxID=2965072 RepID=UPI0021B7BDC7|nr:hypothetical protein [Microbacterium sp. Marseille-Q6965]